MKYARLFIIAALLDAVAISGSTGGSDIIFDNTAPAARETPPRQGGAGNDSVAFRIVDL